MNIRKFEPKDYQSLVEFNTVVFNKRNKIEESINYRFFKNPYAGLASPEILVAEDNDGIIVGQLLILPSEFSYQRKTLPAFWGMDFFVHAENRNSLTGVILANKFKNLKHSFGLGLTDTSLAIFEALNYKIIGYMPKYLRINNIFTALRFLLPFNDITLTNYSFPDSVSVKTGQFNRVFDAEEITTVDGYWNENLIEFSRNKEFLAWRYFYYQNKYYVYKYLSTNNEASSKPVFLVVRPIVWKKLNCLLLVDYRFDFTDKNLFNNILSVAVKLSKKLHLTATITGCSLPGLEKNLKNKWFFKFGRKLEIITKFEIENINRKLNTDVVLTTFADSDCDFYYGSDKW